MSDLELRYKIAPQMKDYDRLPMRWLPYLMFFNAGNYSSEAVNTDSMGFRVTAKNGREIKNFISAEGKESAVIVGNSLAFGVGATKDRYSIPSLLNEKSDLLWFNFGGRAFSSTQEFLLFSMNKAHFKKLKKVIILSGINDLSYFFMARKYSKDMGSFYYWDMFNSRMNAKKPDARREFLEFLIKDVMKDKINTELFSRSDFIKYFFGKKPAYPENFLKDEIFKKIDDHDSQKDELLFVIKRELENWSYLSKALGFEMYYCLQPFANWIKRELSPEEKELFKILDNLEMQNKQWSVLKEKLNQDQYLWLKENLKTICNDLSMPFFDMNEIMSKKKLDNKWLFVDRAHLTDEGSDIVSDIIANEVKR